VMERRGFAVEGPPYRGLPTAFRAEPPATRGARPCIAFLAEYDALPGIGHGCGHNLIAAASVGAALALKEAAAKAGGSVLLLGTPAEETTGGKIELLRAGAFDATDAAMMFHPAQETRVNTTSLASQSLEIVFHGKEAHAAASPELGVNALDALISFYVSLDMLKKHLRKDVRIPGYVKEGGTRANVVPARASGVWSVRAKDSSYLDYVLARVRDNAEAAARAHGARCEIFTTENRYEDMRTNGPLAEACGKYLKEAGFALIGTPRETMGSLDMGNVSRKVPSIHPMVAICDKISAHSEEFARAAASERAEEAAFQAARALALTGAEFLSRPDFARSVREAFGAGSA
jgi:amidohydrolase